MRPGASSDWSAAHVGLVLVESLGREQGDGSSPVDVKQLDTDLEFILIDKAKPKSDILQRITNLQKHGGVMMYAQVVHGDIGPRADGAYGPDDEPEAGAEGRGYRRGD